MQELKSARESGPRQFSDVQCRGLPLLSLRSSKRARSDLLEGAVAVARYASGMWPGLYWLRFIFGNRKDFMYELPRVLIIVWHFKPDNTIEVSFEALHLAC